MLEQFQILLYIIPALVISLVAFRSGRLNKPKEKTLKVLMVTGIALPWIDVLETALGFEHEGNPLFLAQYNLSPLLASTVFILLHLLLSLLAFYCGNKGRKQENVVWRVFLVFLDSMLIILVITNAISLTYLWTR